MHLRALVHDACPGAVETIKWGFPHFEYKGCSARWRRSKRIARSHFWHADMRATAGAQANFDAMSPSHRREYIEWLLGAKRDETRSERLATVIEWIGEGKPKEWKYRGADEDAARPAFACRQSITSSARCRTAGEIVMPRALAVARLITSSNVVGCSMGKSPGFAPFRILST